MVQSMRAPGSLSVCLVARETVDDVDPLDHEDAVLLLDLTGHGGGESTGRRRDPARLQRASERSGQSATRGGDDVVERRREFLLGLDSIVIRDGPMHPEHGGLLRRR